MSALVSSRLLFFVGESIPFGRLLNVSGVSYYHRNVRFLSRFRHDSGPLTLASLGFEREVQTVEKRNEVESTKKSKEVDAIKRSKEVDTIERSKEVDTIERSKEVNTLKRSKEVNTLKRNEEIGLYQLGSPIQEPKSKGKVIRVKAAEQRKPLEIEAAPFAAKSFPELGLPPLLLERLEKEGFTTPTDVQSTAVPTILKGYDVVIQSYTGSGKTLAYLLPILSEVGPLSRQYSLAEDSGRKKDVEAVIVAPSRELGMQIVREVEKLLGPDKRMVQQLVGGANKARQEEALKKNKPAIVVGTPGRIAEISAVGRLHSHGCQFLVLDEVDELLAFNFREDMHRILEHVGRRSGAGPQSGNGCLPKRAGRQTIMVSATVPFSVVRAAQSWGRDPVLVRAKSVSPLESVSPAGRGNLPVPSSGTPSSETQQATQAAASESMPPLLKHYYCTTNLQHKVDTLRRCVHALDANCVIVFMNQNKQLKDTVHKLEARGINAAELHGDLNKLQRSTVLKKFRSGELRILVTNELAARGLDVAECDLVVNLGLPTDSIHYAHRAGRTGRLGRRGDVVTICEQHEVFVVKKLRKQLGVAIQHCDFVEGGLLVKDDD